MHHTTEQPFITEEELQRLQKKSGREFESGNRRSRRKAIAEQRKYERRQQKENT